MACRGFVPNSDPNCGDIRFGLAIARHVAELYSPRKMSGRRVNEVTVVSEVQPLPGPLTRTVESPSASASVSLARTSTVSRWFVA
jgi:hypothetical protein